MISRDFPVGLRNCPRATARRVCAIYWNFSVSVGIRRKRTLRGGAGVWCWGGAKYATRVPDVDRIGPPGNRAIARRTSETAPSSLSVGLRNLLGFRAIRRKSAYTVPTRGGRVTYVTRRVCGRPRRILRKSRRPPPNLGIRAAPARWVCAVYCNFPGFGGDGAREGDICGPPAPRSAA